MAASVKDILNQRGIEHLLTMPGTPQQNGKAEQFNRTIMDKAMSMLHTAGLFNGFWEHAISMATHIYNRTPHETWNAGHIPDISYFRVFGCKAYMHVPADKWHKLDAKAVEVTFVGYELGSKGYRLWDKNTRSVHLSRDVTFDKSSFPSKSNETSSTPMSQPIIPFYPVCAEPNTPAMPQIRAPSPTPTMGSEDDVEDILLSKVERPQTPPINILPLPTTPKKELKAPTSPPPRQSAVHTQQLPLTPELRMPGGMQQQLQEVDVAPWRSTRTCVPNPRYFNTDNTAHAGGQLGNAELLVAAYVGQDPASYAEAMKSSNVDEWVEVCQYEIDTLNKNKTWELVDLPAGRKAVKSKWVFKHKADGRFHAHLVAKGFTQIPSLDYDETFSPVIHFESLRLLLALAALKDWEVHQLDVKCHRHGVEATRDSKLC